MNKNSKSYPRDAKCVTIDDLIFSIDMIAATRILVDTISTTEDPHALAEVANLAPTPLAAVNDLSGLLRSAMEIGSSAGTAHLGRTMCLFVLKHADFLGAAIMYLEGKIENCKDVSEHINFDFPASQFPSVLEVPDGEE